MQNLLGTLLLSLIALSACGSESEGDGAEADDSCQYANDGVCDEPEYCAVDTDATDCGGGGGGSFTVEGLPAVEFYNQFVYRIEPSESLPHNNATADKLDLWLLSSGVFYVTYGDFDNKKSVTGNWSVQQTRLGVGDIATVSGLTYNGQHALRIQFNDSAPSELRGQSATLRRASSNTSLANCLNRNDDGVCDADLGDICGYRDETDCC